MLVVASVAVIAAVPIDMAVANPADPVAFETKAADEDDVQVTIAVIF
jgi:hypothetical protein